MSRRWSLVLPLAVATLSLAAGEERDPVLAPLADLRSEIARVRSEAANLRERAHRAIDSGAYDASIAAIQSLAAAEAALPALHARLDALIAPVASAMIPRLGSADHEARERASARLSALGRGALPAVAHALDRGTDPEMRLRLRALHEALRRIDPDGSVRQWALQAKASSEFSNPNWAAQQATGPPNTLQAGDRPTAWAPREKDAGVEWLELAYAQRVQPVRVRVRETLNPGAVVRLEGRDGPGAEWQTLWEGRDTTAQAPGWLEASVEGAAPITAVRVVLDTRLVAGWNEVDAVELVGLPR